MLRYPFQGTPILTNPYRDDKYSRHLGEDYAVNHRTAIIAVAGGVVISAKGDEKRQWIANTQSDPYKPLGFPLRKRNLTTADYGNFIKIDHGLNKNGKKVYTLYAHLDEVLVYAGKMVKEGELIGYSDNTGNSTGNHLHWEIRENDIVVDPNKFDYSFTNENGGVEEVDVYNLQDEIKVSVGMLYVRSGPARMYPQSGSKILKKGDIVSVVGFTNGESIDGNNLWYKSAKGNYFWAGGTEKPKPTLPVVDKKLEDMTVQEKELKLAEFEARKASIEARKAELESALEANKADEASYLADWELFAAEPVEEPVVEPVVEVAPEPVVEAPVEEVAVVEEPVAEPVMDAVDQSQEDKISKLEAMVKALQEKLGL